jgi:acyl transferase domain-containing protein
MSRPRVVLVCPGRGSYGREQLGSLVRTPSVEAANALRAGLGRPTPSEMDGAPSYSSRFHVAGENASILTAACSLADRDQLGDIDVVGVIGNSMGWYTALVVAGALPLTEGLRLIETMGQYQVGNVIGGQVLYPLVDEAWRTRPSPEVTALLARVPELHVSIHLGGQLVLGGSDAAVQTAMRELPARRIGERDAPMQLPLHSAFHTPWMADTSARARRDLADLHWQAPSIPLVDGRGQVFRPYSADPGALADYTLGHQVVAPYDFSASVRVVMREYAPDHLVLLGPGGNLGGAVAQALIAEGWAGLDGRESFLARQASAPIVLSMSRPEQRARVVRA